MAEPRDHYSSVSIGLHWTIAALILLNLGLGLLMAWAGPSGRSLFPIHASLGLTVLILSVVRVGWRLANPWPPLPAGMEAWEKLLARATHVAFYVLILAVPLLGWLTVSANPKSQGAPFFGLTWPKLPVEASRAQAEQFGDLHGALAFAMIAVLVLHVAGAIKHTFVQRHGVLGRMLPGAHALSGRPVTPD